MDQKKSGRLINLYACASSGPISIGEDPPADRLEREYIDVEGMPKDMGKFMGHSEGRVEVISYHGTPADASDYLAHFVKQNPDTQIISVETDTAQAVRIKIRYFKDKE